MRTVEKSERGQEARGDERGRELGRRLVPK